uniref:Uncharacterized protein n=1 Tax=Anopheles arabiensis TaxID=7173 RepID=A0A182IEA8_ANOAR
MGEITPDDIMDAIKKSASRKSPGPDGIPKEFYFRAYGIIHRELHLILNEALEGGFPRNFVDGVIVLVGKRGSTGAVSCFRPISLLNTDFKLLLRVIKPRLDSIIRKWGIISTAQKCSNKPCNIFQAVLSVKERVVDLRNQRKYGLVRLLRTVGERSSSRILVNGNLSPSLPIRRSVRQGDPLSMHFFVLYLNPLITRLEIICCDQDDLINAYADDVSVVTTFLSKLEEVKAAIEAFGRTAGAKLNVEKNYGTTHRTHHTNSLPNTCTVAAGKRLRLLGILFTDNIREAMGHNWENAVQHSGIHLIRLHRVRNLNLAQKVVLLNTFLLPKLWFIASVCSARSMDIDLISRTVRSFLWDGSGGFRIPLTQLALPRRRGGLNLHIPAITATALLVNRLRQMMIERLSDPKVALESPSTDWRWIWKNVSSFKLSSHQRSMLYLLVHNKVSHGLLLDRMNRASSTCSFCSREETLEHRFALCSRVAGAWSILMQAIEAVVPNHNLNFPSLLLPILSHISIRKRIPILRLFANYIIYIVGNNNAVIDEEILKCSL